MSQDLEVDWRLGAEIFESLLVDHDWAVNTSNWAYFAGALLLCCCVLCRLQAPCTPCPLGDTGAQIELPLYHLPDPYAQA